MIKKLTTGAVCLFLASTLTGCAVVSPGDRGVKVSMGQLDRQLIQPGLTAFNPLTDQIHEFSIQQQSLTGTSTPLTADQQVITLDYTVQYRLPEGRLIELYEKYSGDLYKDLVTPQVQEAFRQVVSGYRAEGVTKGVTTIKDQVLAMVRKNLDGKVDVVDIPITHVTLPPSLTEAINEKQVAEQKALKKQYELEQAKRQAEITITNANAEAQAIQRKAAALQSNPKLVELTIAEKWDGKTVPQIVVTDKGGPGLLLPAAKGN